MKLSSRWLIPNRHDAFVYVLWLLCPILLLMPFLLMQPNGGPEAALADPLRDPAPLAKKISLVSFQFPPDIQEKQEKKQEKNQEKKQVLGRDWVAAERERREKSVTDVIPEHQRWRIDHGAENISQYARQLSFFELDIAVIQIESSGIVRLRDAAGKPQVIESNRNRERKTLYFTHASERLQRWDETLAKENGVDLEKSFTVLFYPMKTRVLLRQVETTYLQEVGRPLSEVRQSRFKIVPTEDGFQFKLIGVNFRPAKSD